VVHPDDVEEPTSSMRGSWPAGHGSCAISAVSACATAGSPGWPGQLGGRVSWVSVSVSRIPESVDRVEHVVVHIEDISERKQREADLSTRPCMIPCPGWRTGRC
jgi:hypothetical protein